MNLKEHKQLLWEYEQTMRELDSLRSASADPSTAAQLQAMRHDLTFAMRPEDARPIIAARLITVEREAARLADLLGIEHPAAGALPRSLDEARQAAMAIATARVTQ